MTPVQRVTRASCVDLGQGKDDNHAVESRASTLARAADEGDGDWSFAGIGESDPQQEGDIEKPIAADLVLLDGIKQD